MRKRKKEKVDKSQVIVSIIMSGLMACVVAMYINFGKSVWNSGIFGKIWAIIISYFNGAMGGY
jgi:hypothetical protein